MGPADARRPQAAAWQSSAVIISHLHGACESCAKKEKPGARCAPGKRCQAAFSSFKMRMNSSPVMVSFSSRYRASSCSLSIFSFKILSFNCNYTYNTTEVIGKGQQKQTFFILFFEPGQIEAVMQSATKDMNHIIRSLCSCKIATWFSMIFIHFEISRPCSTV